MRTRHAYRVVAAPRYRSELDDGLVHDNLLVQRTLWSALQYQVVSGLGASIELRLASYPDRRRLDLWIIVSDVEDRDASVSLVERLLPRDYRWEAERGNTALAPGGDGTGWRVARLLRRVEFLTLPFAAPWLMTNAYHAERTGDRASHADAPPIVADYDQRHLPTVGVDLRDQLRAHSLCVPILGSMPEDVPNRWRLCQELQEAAPAVLSIGLHPLENDVLGEDRSVATHLRRCVEPLGPALADAGFSRSSEVLRAFDRYWLPEDQLCLLTLRVAGSTDIDAISVAHHVASRLGSSRAFEVRPPSRTVASIDELGDPEVELPTHTSLTKHPAYWSRHLDSWLGAVGVARDETFADGFLLRMPHLYTLEEAENVLRLPFAFEEGLPGIETKLVPPFYSPALEHQPLGSRAPERRIRIGVPERQQPAVGHHGAHWHSIPTHQLARHAFVTGTTGSGKTTTSNFLLRELDRLNVPFMVVEPVKTEYYDALKGRVPELQRWHFEGSADGRVPSDFFIMDPMRLQSGVSVSRHVGYLTACFQAAFPMTPLMSLILENGLLEYYCKSPKRGACGLGLLQRGGPAVHRFDERHGNRLYPSFDHFCDFFLGPYLQGEFTPPPMLRDKAAGGELWAMLENFRKIFMRRFESLRRGPLGLAFRRANELVASRGNDVRYFNPLPHWLSRPTIIELDGITSAEHKSLAMALLLTFLYEHRQAEDLVRRERGEARGSDQLSHVLVLEEAHRLLRAEPRATASTDEVMATSPRAVELFVDMLAEIRAYGEGLVIVEQIPTKIVPEVVKNTNLKIMMRLPSEDDQAFLAASMSFDQAQRDFVSTLRTGEMAVYEENLDRPVLLRMPNPSDWDAMSLFESNRREKQCQES